MPKNKNKKNKKNPAKSNANGNVNDNNQPGRLVNIYRWKQQKKFTVLEDAIIKILERKKSISDEKIAEAFCLSKGDVKYIVDEINEVYGKGEDNNEIQGDHSYRSLCDGFSRDLPDKIAIEKKEKDKPTFIFDSLENAEFLDKMKREGHSKELPINDKKRGVLNEMKKDGYDKVEVVSLMVTYDLNDEKTDFLCSGNDIPSAFCAVLRDKLLPKKN